MWIIPANICQYNLVIYLFEWLECNQQRFSQLCQLTIVGHNRLWRSHFTGNILALIYIFHFVSNIQCVCVCVCVCVCELSLDCLHNSLFSVAMAYLTLLKYTHTHAHTHTHTEREGESLSRSILLYFNACTLLSSRTLVEGSSISSN